MDYDISQPVPQGSDGAQDAENSRIAAIANELERLCAVHEAQLGDSQADVSRFKSDNSTKISDISHNEDAWQKYVDSGQMINFDMAFTLKAI